MDEPLINTLDFILVPFFFMALLAIVIFYKKKYSHNILVQKYLVKIFLCKVFGGLLYAFLIYYYWGFGDSATYFKETLVIKQLVHDGKVGFLDVFLKDYTYFRENFELRGAVNESGFLVVKVALLLSYLSFNSFLICTMLFATLSIIGTFKLFETFVSFAPRWHFIIACFVIFFPSLNIYGSGILKDTLSFCTLGLFFYSSINISRKKTNLADYLIIPISLYFIIVIKAYIIAAMMIPLILFISMNMLRRIQSKFLRILALPLVLGVFAGILVLTYQQINESLGSYAVDKLEKSVSSYQTNYAALTEDADSNFDIGEIQPTPMGLLKKMPIGFVATLYRPFLWEARKPIMLLSALESLFILLFTLFVLIKAGPGAFVKQIIFNPIVFLCMGYSIIFASLVGITSLNFGTLARYRVPVIPFYLMGLVLILYNTRNKVNKNMAQIEE